MSIVEALAFVLEALLARERMHDRRGEVLHTNGAAILALPSQLDDNYRAVKAGNFACWWRKWKAPLARPAAHACDCGRTAKYDAIDRVLPGYVLCIGFRFGGRVPWEANSYLTLRPA